MAVQRRRSSRDVAKARKGMRRVAQDGPARPRVEIDWPQLGVYVERGCSLDECAVFLGISLSTLKRRLREEPEGRDLLRRKRVDWKDRCRRVIAAQAARGNSMALKYLAENVLGWRVARLVQVSDPNGGPVKADLSVRSIADLAALALGQSPQPEVADATEDAEADSLGF